MKIRNGARITYKEKEGFYVGRTRHGEACIEIKDGFFYRVSVVKESDIKKQMRSTAGYTEGTASREAADFIKVNLTGLRKKVLEAIKSAGKKGLTGSEVAEKIGAWDYSAKPRCTELAEAGYIMASQNMRENTRGRKEIVWIAA